jgi:GDP-mannose transporter
MAVVRFLAAAVAGALFCVYAEGADQWAAPIHDHRVEVLNGQVEQDASNEKPIGTEARPRTSFDSRAPLVLGAGLFLLTAGSIFTRNYDGAKSLFAVAGFMTCSSMMLIVNKLAITCLPLPATVLALQLVTCGAGVRLAGALGLCEVEGLKIEKIKAFGVTPLAFLATLLANIKILEYANVETFIMVRNATPLATSVLDWVFLGRELPDRKSTSMLFLSLVGSIGYVTADSGFQVRAYSWAVAWVIIFLFDQVYIKHVISTVPMTSWSRVYYNNIIAGIFAMGFALTYERANWSWNAWVGDISIGVLVIAISCAMGTAMSYFAFVARDALSATSFTVVGNVCKVLSVFGNIFLWDKHATSVGLTWLAVVIFGSAMYGQAPLRKSESLPLMAGKAKA